jgi:tripartite-type tricarboxylate transporter receptor subunit TctC
MLLDGRRLVSSWTPNELYARTAGSCARLAIAIALLATAAAPACAQGPAPDYPTRPVRWLVGFAPGGSTDVLVRLFGEWMQERLGQPFLVENKPGAGSNLAAEAAVNAPPDGYTLLSVTSANAINATVNWRTLAFDITRQIAPVAGLAYGPSVLVVNPTLPVHTVAELIAYAKANPGKINMGSAGVGTTSHLAGELFKAMAGVDLVHVPYRGAAPALTDLIAGQVQVVIDAMITTLPHIQSGKLRALGVTTAKRSELLADTPAIAETVSGYEAIIWYGLGAPHGTPAEVIGKLNREINAGLASPKIKARLAELGSTPLALSPDEFGAFLKAEIAKWEQVIKVSGTKVD